MNWFYPLCLLENSVPSFRQIFIMTLDNVLLVCVIFFAIIAINVCNNKCISGSGLKSSSLLYDNVNDPIRLLYYILLWFVLLYYRVAGHLLSMGVDPSGTGGTSPPPKILGGQGYLRPPQ